jgi:GT2 family glycosyltransferase
MDLSVILVTFNSSSFIRECLRSILEQAEGIDHEVIVVDNDSGDETCQIIEKEFPQATLVKNERNLGFAGANNLALRQARGEFVLLINPDTRWNRGEMGRALQFLRDHPEAGGLGARLILEDGAWQKSHGNFPTLLRELKEALYLPRFFPGSKWSRGIFIYKEKRETTAVDWVSCAFFLGRRDVMAEAGFLDERYFMYYEDIDLSKGIRERGKELYYYPDIQILHFQRSPRIYDYGESSYLYFHKHFGLPFAKILRWVLVFKFLLRVVIFSMLAFFTCREVFREKRKLNGRSLRFHLFDAGHVLKELRNGFKRSPDKDCDS